MNDKDILVNAPEGATHVDNEGDYWLMQPDNSVETFMDGEWLYCNPQEPLRSLADIKRIVELEKENTKLKKIVDNHSGGFVACMTGNQFTANNLKQQAKALNEYAYSNKPLTKRGLNLKSIALIDQAKALKEPKT
jgi:hypothetical protein